jgi:hypothetical protein
VIRIRRVDCGTGGCEEGCAADEIAISAFCGPNSFAASTGERNAQCSGDGNMRMPAVLICAKK